MKIREKVVLNKTLAIIFSVFAIVLLVAIIYAINANNFLCFVTVEKIRNSKYKEKDPELFIITKKDDFSQIASFFSDETINKIDQVDFEQYFLATILMGWNALSSPEIFVEITSIKMEDQEIQINAHFSYPRPGIGAATAVSSPFHIVKVPKNNLHGTFRVILLKDNIYILEKEVTFP